MTKWYENLLLIIPVSGTIFRQDIAYWPAALSISMPITMVKKHERGKMNHRKPRMHEKEHDYLMWF